MPFGPETLERWVAAGLLSAPEAARLSALVHAKELGIETVRDVLESVIDESSGSSEDWSWGAGRPEDLTVPELFMAAEGAAAAEDED